ncbi:MAG: hypothetical protein J0H62_09220 [Rhizobiales bacterium]|nr:hypothetical protein [Hyphomicrobiales bacterium]
MLRLRDLSLVLAVVLVSGAASAETLRTFRIANWQAGAYTRQGSGEFNHCAASARYRSGVSMMFAINRNYKWSMGFASPEWSLVRGNGYDIAFKIDGSSVITGRAVAIGPTQVEVQLEDTSALFERFRWGQLLRVTSAGQVLNFKLTDTSAVLPELLRCVSRHAGTRAPAHSAGGFFGQPANNAPAAPQAAPVANATTQAEATTLVANLLAQSGIPGFQILGPNEVGALKADAAWRAGDVIGTVSVVSGEAALDRLPGRLIGNAAQSCRGKFFSGSLPDTQEGTAAVRVFTACQSGEKPLTVYYLGVSRPAGGIYVLTTSAMGSEQPAKEADQNLRAAVYKVLSK